MNIEQIQKTETQNNDAVNEATTIENTQKVAKANESLSLNRDIANKQAFIDFLNSENPDLKGEDDQLNNTDQAIISGFKGKVDPGLIKDLQLFALKNKIPIRIKDLNDVKMLMASQNLFNNDKESSYKIDKIDKSDIDFLKNCVDNPNMLINSVNPQTTIINYITNNTIERDSTAGEVSYKSLNVSKSLASMIDYAFKTQKPVRLEFEGNSSVILKIDTEGKLTAQFISSDKAMETLLKNSIPQLRSKMDNEGIPYKDITYKEQKNSRQNQQEDKSYE